MFHITILIIIYSAITSFVVWSRAYNSLEKEDVEHYIKIINWSDFLIFILFPMIPLGISFVYLIITLTRIIKKSNIFKNLNKPTRSENK